MINRHISSKILGLSLLFKSH